VIFRREVAVQRAKRDLSPIRDPPHLDRVVPTLTREVNRSVEDALTPRQL
jgi:hypothetical protein